MKWLGIVALVALAPIAYSLAFPSVTVRYRLTLDAVVDGVPKTGSGVIEVTYGKQSRLAGQHPLVIGVTGEAVALDLDSRGSIFALLKAGSDSRSAPVCRMGRAQRNPSIHLRGDMMGFAALYPSYDLRQSYVPQNVCVTRWSGSGGSAYVAYSG